jgi:hypothetical protein
MLGVSCFKCYFLKGTLEFPFELDNDFSLIVNIFSLTLLLFQWFSVPTFTFGRDSQKCCIKRQICSVKFSY